jgi:hypothetical protein
MSTARRTRLIYWIATTLFSLQMVFTAFAQLRLPQVAEAFRHLGFPSYFRVELSLAKLLGVALLLTPVPERLKEWAYAGFAFDLGSAVIAHVAMGDGPEAWGWALATALLGVVSYVSRRRLATAKGEPIAKERPWSTSTEGSNVAGEAARGARQTA